MIARWMRPEATLATTSGHFSSDEASYADDIKQAAKKNAWRVHFGLLDNPGAPSVAEILGIAEAAVHTSIQPKSGSWRFEIGVEVACGMVDGIKSLV